MELQKQVIKVLKLVETVVKAVIDANWELPHRESAEIQFQKGLKELPAVFGLNAIDPERVVDYMVYQLYRVRQYLEQGGWQSNWFFSQYAKEKYKKQFLSETGKTGMNYYINLWLEEGGLNRQILTNMIQPPRENPLARLVYLEAEEPIKERFLNSEDGLALCLSSTTGWSPFSPTCNKCDNRMQCEEFTAIKYPELMRYRKEAKYGN